MSTTNTSIFERATNPIFMAILVYLAGVVIMLGGKLIGFIGLLPVPQKFPWLTAAAFMLFFAMFNSIYALSTKNMMKYWARSIYSYLGLAILSGLTAYFVSSMPINDAGSFRWIYVVLTIGYLVFLAIMTSVRRIVEFAMKEEWTQPRIRRKKKK